jgi:hypothetical protein
VAVRRENQVLGKALRINMNWWSGMQQLPDHFYVWITHACCSVCDTFRDSWTMISEVLPRMTCVKTAAVN